MASREVWRKRIGRWRESGLSKQEFARQLRVSPKSITYWDWKLRREVADLATKVAPMGLESGIAVIESESGPWPPPAAVPASPSPAPPAGEPGSTTRRPRRGRPPKAKTAAKASKASKALGPVRWLQVVGGIDDEPEDTRPRSTMLELVLAGGRAVRVPRGFDAETLARLISVVEIR